MSKVIEVPTTPKEDVKIWRYMDVGRFLWLLHSRALYFSRRHELDDKWEGANPQSEIRKGSRERKAIGMPSFAEKIADEAVFNCWHENDRESVAMWRLYTSGREGVAIQTTIDRLYWLLKKSQYWAMIQVLRVQYIDYDQEDDPPREGGHYGLLTCKRRSYEHEREVRAILQTVPGSEGILIHVDLQRLIQRIVVAPTYPAWAIGSLQDAVERVGISAKVETSDLLRSPVD